MSFSSLYRYNILSLSVSSPSSFFLSYNYNNFLDLCLNFLDLCLNLYKECHLPQELSLLIGITITEGENKRDVRWRIRDDIGLLRRLVLKLVSLSTFTFITKES